MCLVGITGHFQNNGTYTKTKATISGTSFSSLTKMIVAEADPNYGSCKMTYDYAVDYATEYDNKRGCGTFGMTTPMVSHRSSTTQS